MLSNVFNYVAGAASIISLVIALTPFFPEYKRYIRYAAVFFIGTLVGSLFSSASSQAIVIQFQGSVLQTALLIAVMIGLAIVIVIILAIALGGEVEEYHKAAAGGATVLSLAALCLYGITTLPDLTKNQGQRDIDESLGLARYNKQSGSLSRAMQYYCDAMRAAQYQPREREIVKEANEICVP